MTDTGHIVIPTKLQQLITADQAWHYKIIPKEIVGTSLAFFMGEQSYTDALKYELELLFGKQIEIEKTNQLTIEKTLGKYYRQVRKEGVSKIATKINAKGEEFWYSLIQEAHGLECSDIHLESFEDKCRVRLRIDGKLIEKYTIDKEDYPALVNKVKIMANLDIAEKRLPQDGRIFFKIQEAKFDIRVSVLPTLYNEKIVLRLLARDAKAVNIEELGFGKKQLEDYKRGILRPHGIILISGPTGSGKTTTLYATLKILNKENTNILTIEDPIEYTLDGINQVQLKESIGLTFVAALRTFLRQDPDIIMLGEIRDAETAQMAIRAALTGHLVLSTIHTNSAWGTISRLSDMGIPAFLLADTLNLTVAQRLVRLLCPACKVKQPLDFESLRISYKPPFELTEIYHPCGCPECYYTGFKGRKAVFEVIAIDHDLSQKIRNGQRLESEDVQTKQISTLSDQAFSMLANGDTSIEEVLPILTAG